MSRAASRPVDVTRGIVPIGEFKAHASELIRQLRESGRPIVITQRGRATAVLVSPEEFEESTRQQDVRQRIERRIATAPTGPGRTGAELRAQAREAVRRKRSRKG